MTSLLRLERVGKTYSASRGLLRGRMRLHAVDEVSLDLGAGEVLGLVGESGCGKTTLAKMLLGLEPPSRGRVLFDGHEIGDDGRARRRLARRIQPVFQDPYSSLNPRKRVREIIMLPLLVHRVGEAAQRSQAVAAMLERVGLPQRVADSYPNQLSGGQRQRVAIARALVMRPQIVICDEPTSALDVSVQSQILNLLLELKQDLGLTYLFISHNLAVVEHLATRVAVMYLGRIVEQNATAKLFASPRHPYTKALLGSVLTPEPGRGIPDTHLGVAYPNPLQPPSGCHFHPRCAERLQRCEREAPPAREDARGFVECHLYPPG